MKILVSSVYANLLSTAGNVLELNSSIDKREKSIVSSDTYVLTGVDFSSTLSYENIACDNCLSVSLLNAKALRLGITAVFRRTNALFVSEELQTKF